MKDLRSILKVFAEIQSVMPPRYQVSALSNATPLFNTDGLNEGPRLRLRTTTHCVKRAALSSVNTSKAAGSARTFESKPRRLPRPDPLFTKTELRSERYNAYRKKGRNTSDRQKWNDELEDSFQLGVSTHKSNDFDISCWLYLSLASNTKS